MERPVQHFSDEYLEHCKKMSPTQIVTFLESFRMLTMQPGALQQINVRVPSNILKAFKAKAARDGIPYQKKIKELMSDWALNG